MIENRNELGEYTPNPTSKWLLFFTRQSGTVQADHQRNARQCGAMCMRIGTRRIVVSVQINRMAADERNRMPTGRKADALEF